MPTQTIAHVKLGTEPKEVPAGPTIVAALKALLGVPETFSLFLKEEGKSRLLGDGEIIDVKSGLHFTANPGGGVS
jgi:hypothetical protein